MLYHVCFVTHLITCIYKIECDLAILSDPNNIDLLSYCSSSQLGNNNQGVVYLSSLYWSWGSITGTAQVALPVTLFETTFICLLFCFGVILLAYFAANALIIVDSITEKSIVMLSELSRFTSFTTKHPELNKHIKSRVLEYYEYLNLFGKFQTILSDYELLSELPDDIETSILMFLVSNIIDKVKYLQSLISTLIIKNCKSLILKYM